MRPVFVPSDRQAPPGALAVDGAVIGAAAIYSHWQGDHTTPAELAADTSTAMLVRAAGDAPRWLAPFSVVCNNHIDADGLLSVLCACRPELARAHGPRLIAAATAGDFTTWTGAAGMELMLRLHQLIHRHDTTSDDHQPSGPGWQQRCLDGLIGTADYLLGGSWPGAAERQAAIAQAEAAIARLRAVPPTVHGRLAVVTWRRVVGHVSDPFLGVHTPDDLPLIALSTAIAPTCFQLLLEETIDGVVVQLDAPRHSWARTVDLPAVPWPDLTPLAGRLRALDPGVDWLTRPAAQAVGFTCLLASTRDNRPAATRLTPAQLITTCAAGFT